MAEAPQPRPWREVFGLDQRLVAKADEGVVRQPDPMVLRMLGLDGGNVAQAKGPGGGLQRAKASGPDRAFEQRPVRGPRYVPHLIQVWPAKPAERMPAIRG